MKWHRPGNNRQAILLISLFIFFLAMNSHAQQNLLSRRVTVRLEKVTAETALSQIERASGVHFSYNTDIISSPGKLSLSANNRRLDKVLSELLGSSYYFKSTGSYVIILREAAQIEKKPAIKEILVKGTILEQRSGDRVVNATVYDMAGMESEISDSNGNFILKLEPVTSTIALRCKKAGYSDDIALIRSDRDTNLVFKLKKLSEPISTMVALTPGSIPGSDSLNYVLIGRFVSHDLFINSNNVEIFERRPAQLSIIPSVGTNMKMSGSVVNNFSINLIGGYSRGVAGFEVAGLFNITRNNVKGFQAAGFSNIGADTVKGVQIAGGINYCKKYFNGLQIAGMANIARQSARGVQIAGLFNYAPSPDFQLAALNIADTNTGRPLGVINIIRGGYYAIGFTFDEQRFNALHFSMGTNRLYSIVGMSARRAGDSLSWGIDYGLGKRLFPRSVIGIDMELLSSVININSAFDQTTTTRVSLSAQLSLRLVRGIHITAGPTGNIFIAKSGNSIVSSYIDAVAPANRWHATSLNTRFDAWQAWQAGVKISL
jgi:hypothetical protein